MEELLQAMRAIAEPTRIRILALCAHSELTVSEIVQILGQSQPRVSRHLRLMVEAGVLQRYQEGTWAWYRLVSRSALVTGKARYSDRVASLAEELIDLIPDDDPVVSRDLERLDNVRRERERQAAEFFASNAEDWDRLRALHVDEAEVDAAVLKAFGDRTINRLLDIGTGTGTVLALLGRIAGSAIGVDLSPQMLSLARTLIDREKLTHCQVRQADMYQLPFDGASFDAASLHMVLHYAEDPVAVLREAARVLAPNGRLVVVDFAPHNVEELRARHAHRWPGIDDKLMQDWFLEAGLEGEPVEKLEGGALTVCLWKAVRPEQAENNHPASVIAGNT